MLDAEFLLQKRSVTYCESSSQSIHFVLAKQCSECFFNLSYGVKLYIVLTCKS